MEFVGQVRSLVENRCGEERREKEREKEKRKIQGVPILKVQCHEKFFSFKASVFEGIKHDSLSIVLRCS